MQGRTNNSLIKGSEEDSEHEADEDDHEPVLWKDEFLIVFVACPHLLLLLLSLYHLHIVGPHWRDDRSLFTDVL